MPPVGSQNARNRTRSKPLSDAIEIQLAGRPTPSWCMVGSIRRWWGAGVLARVIALLVRRWLHCCRTPACARAAGRWQYRFVRGRFAVAPGQAWERRKS